MSTTSARRASRTARRFFSKAPAGSLNAFVPINAGRPEDKQDEIDVETNTQSKAPRSGASGRQLADGFLAVKDNIATVRSWTTCGSRTLGNYRSPFGASVVRRLKKKIPIGRKTNMDEFGMGSHSTTSYWGRVHNVPPYRMSSPGGSSGGSAVAVASAAVHIALGTDTGGSVRLPAAYTNIVGFKPSYGMVSRFGLVPYANSMDTVGFLGPTTSIIKETLYRVAKHDPLDPTSILPTTRARMEKEQSFDASRSSFETHVLPHKLKGLRIGLPIEYNIEELSGAVRETWKHVLKQLRSQGHSIHPISLPSTKHALSAYYILAPAEAASNLSKYDGIRYGFRAQGSDAAGGVLYAQTRGESFGDEVKRRIMLGSYSLSSEAIDNYFIQAQKVRRLVQNDFDRVFRTPNRLRDPQQFDLSDMEESVDLENKLGPAQVDVILTPTAPTLPPRLSEVEKQEPVETYMNDVFTVPASLAGLPALTIPYPLPADQQPGRDLRFIGIQIIGQYWEDFYVLSVGSMIEKLAASERARGLSKIRKKARIIAHLTQRSTVASKLVIKKYAYDYKPAASKRAHGRSKIRRKAHLSGLIKKRRVAPKLVIRKVQFNAKLSFAKHWSSDPVVERRPRGTSRMRKRAGSRLDREVVRNVRVDSKLSFRKYRSGETHPRPSISEVIPFGPADDTSASTKEATEWVWNPEKGTLSRPPEKEPSASTEKTSDWVWSPEKGTLSGPPEKRPRPPASTEEDSDWVWTPEKGTSASTGEASEASSGPEKKHSTSAEEPEESDWSKDRPR